MTFSREELAWAAGLFEGEGCFNFTSSHSNRNVRASISMTDRDVLEEFQKVVGFGQIYDKAPAKDGWKQQWTWAAASFEEVQALAAFLWPWLKVRRKTKIKEILAKYHKAEPVGYKPKLARRQCVKKLLKEGVFNQRQIAKLVGISPAMVTLIKQESIN